MSHIFLKLLFLNIIYNAVYCHLQCKEYIIISKEETCSSQPPTQEPITLYDLEWTKENCASESSEILAYDEKYPNDSYVIKFDYTESEPMCVLLLKPAKLLKNFIMIDDDLEYTLNTTKSSHKLPDATKMDKKNNTEVVMPILKCLVKNYTSTCDTTKSDVIAEVETKKTIIDMYLAFVNKSNPSTPESIVNETESEFPLKIYYKAEYICVNKHPKSINNTFHSNYNNGTTKKIIALIAKGNGKELAEANSNQNNKLNCTNIKSNITITTLDQVTALTYNIITKKGFVDEYVHVNNMNIDSEYLINVYIANDFPVIDTKTQFVNCDENFKNAKINVLSTYCNIMEVLKTNHDHGINDKDNVTNTNLLESEFNNVLIRHCEFEIFNESEENYSKSSELLSKYRVYNFHKCTEDYEQVPKNIDRNSINVIMISRKGNTETNATSMEHVDSFMINEGIILEFISSNGSNCNETLNITKLTKGTIISIGPYVKNTTISKKAKRNLIKINLSNCVERHTKASQSQDYMELNIIVNNQNTTSLNSLVLSNLDNTLEYLRNRTTLTCMPSSKAINESNVRKDYTSIMECQFIELDNSKNKTEQLKYDKLIEKEIRGLKSKEDFLCETVSSVQTINRYSVIDLQNCTMEKYKTEENLTKKSFTSEEGVHFQFISNTHNNCNKTFLFNITRGRIITLGPNNTNATFLKIKLVNCVNSYLKPNASNDSLEMNLIINITNLNSHTMYDLQKMIVNATKQAVLSCTYDEKATQVSNFNGAEMECTFIDLSNYKYNTTEMITGVHTEADHKSSTETPTENKGFTLKPISEVTNVTTTTESNTAVNQSETHQYDAMFEVTPRVYLIAVAAIAVVISSVLTYAYCLFKSKQRDYELAHTRDWEAMDVTQF